MKTEIVRNLLTILMAFTAVILAPSGSEAITNHYWGDFDIYGIYSDNVYRTSSSYDDFGFGSNLSAGLRTKFSKSLFSKISYNLNMKNFLLENIENYLAHQGDLQLKLRLGSLGTINIDGGAELMSYPNITVDKYLITQNSNRIYASPELKIYPTGSTSLGGGIYYDNTVFPEYDLDYTGTGFHWSAGQEFTINTYLKASGAYKTLAYNERYIYDISGTSRINTTELRQDIDNSLFISLSQHVPLIKSSFSVNFSRTRLTSNGNYFDFGPGQWDEWKDGDIAGDERLVADYYSCTSNLFELSGKTSLPGGLRLVLSVLTGTKAFDGRLAKDESDDFISPDELRADTPFLISVEIAKNMNDALELDTGNMELSLQCKYENNTSNDYLYNYTATSVFIIARYNFSR